MENVHVIEVLKVNVLGLNFFFCVNFVQNVLLLSTSQEEGAADECKWCIMGQRSDGRKWGLCNITQQGL